MIFLNFCINFVFCLYFYWFLLYCSLFFCAKMVKHEHNSILDAEIQCTASTTKPLALYNFHYILSGNLGMRVEESFTKPKSFQRDHGQSKESEPKRKQMGPNKQPRAMEQKVYNSHFSAVLRAILFCCVCSAWLSRMFRNRNINPRFKFQIFCFY